MILNFINIPNQKEDIDNISKFIQVTNAGIEAITDVYDDHTLDQNISTRAFFLQENLIYRIYAAFHQYKLLIAGMNSKSVIDLTVDPHIGVDPLHPRAYQFSAELSSIVDSIFFFICTLYLTISDITLCISEILSIPVRSKLFSRHYGFIV